MLPYGGANLWGARDILVVGQFWNRRAGLSYHDCPRHHDLRPSQKRVDRIALAPEGLLGQLLSFPLGARSQRIDES